jgi:hypothetical protein
LHHIYVARVVEFPAAALAHADHGQPGRRRSFGQLRTGDGQGRLERGRTQVGELGRGLVQAGRAGEIPGRQVQQRPPVGGAQRDDGIGTRRGRGARLGVRGGAQRDDGIGTRRGRGARLGVRGSTQRDDGIGARPRRGAWLGVTGRSADRPQQSRPQFPGAGPVLRGGPVQHAPVAGVAGQMIGQRGAGAEDGGQAAGERRIGPQRRPEAGCGPVPGRKQPGQPGQRQVRVGRLPERADQLIVEPELADRALGPGGVGEAQPGQPARQRRPARPVRGIAHVGTVVQDGADGGRRLPGRERRR